MKLKYFILSGIIFIAGGLYSCKKEKQQAEKEINPLGQWYKENTWDNNLVYHEDYYFKDNREIEILGRIIDPVSTEIKGYLNRRIGTYAVTGDSLIFTNMNFFGGQTASYSPLSELVFKLNEIRIAQKISFNTIKDSLILTYPPCNDIIGDCIDGIKLARVK